MPGTRLGTLHTLSSDAQDNRVRQMLSITLLRDEGMEDECLQAYLKLCREEVVRCVPSCSSSY